MTTLYMQQNNMLWKQLNNHIIIQKIVYMNNIIYMYYIVLYYIQLLIINIDNSRNKIWIYQ